MKPMIDQSFWSDPDIEAQKSGVKLTALWLMTNSQTSLLGLCGASDQRFAFETGLPSEALQRAIEALPRAFVRFGSLVFVKNYIRHQFGTGGKLKRNNFFVALKSLFLSVKDLDLRSEVLKEYPEFKEALEEGLKGLTKPQYSTDRERKEGKESPERKPQPGIEIPECLRTERFETAWSGYVEYRKQAHLKPLLPVSVRSRMKEFSEWGEETSILAIEVAIRNGAQGIFHPKPQPKNGHRTEAARDEATTGFPRAKEHDLPVL